ncbi:MAG: hypothetical protein OQL16_06610 [Gammaproteobacteria bacterium]|nr:hypothetical protein [Gammaproteobacteria bacterium]
MGIFGYAMMIAFILLWVVLLVKFLRVVKSGKQSGEEQDDDS